MDTNQDADTIERTTLDEDVWMRVAPTWAPPALTYVGWLGTLSVPRPRTAPKDLRFWAIERRR
jgi:hypothetical protein